MDPRYERDGWAGQTKTNEQPRVQGGGEEPPTSKGAYGRPQQRVGNGNALPKRVPTNWQTRGGEYRTTYNEAEHGLLWKRFDIQFLFGNKTHQPYS